MGVGKTKRFLFGGGTYEKKITYFTGTLHCNNMEDNDLKKHKLSFYIGSVLPDIKPSFVYKRHEMDGTYPDIRRHIERLSEGRKLVEKKKAVSYTHLTLPTT